MLMENTLREKACFLIRVRTFLRHSLAQASYMALKWPRKDISSLRPTILEGHLGFELLLTQNLLESFKGEQSTLGNRVLKALMNETSSFSVEPYLLLGASSKTFCKILRANLIVIYK